MKYNKFLLLLIFAFSTAVFGQNKINAELKKELDEIMNLDQSYRELFDDDIKPERRQEILKGFNLTEEQSKNWKIVDDQDKKNLVKVEKIIQQYGYPGKSLVGEPTNKSVFYVIQHSNEEVIGKYLPLIKKAAKKRELPFNLYAMMLDRYLSYQKKPQIYGSQGYGGYWFNDKTGKEEWIEFMWPVKNFKKVNQRRKKAGFSDTFEENATDLYGKDYKMVTIEQAIKISNYKKHWN